MWRVDYQRNQMQPEDFESQVRHSWHMDDGVQRRGCLLPTDFVPVSVEDYRQRLWSKTVGAALLLFSSAAPMLQLPVSDCCHSTSEDRIDSAVNVGSFYPIKLHQTPTIDIISYLSVRVPV